MTRSWLVIAAIVVLGLAAAMLVGMHLGARSTGPAAADVDPQARGEVSAPAIREPVERPLPLARPSPDPLPPVDAPLADTFEELMVRADRGDDRAACRLALEMQACYWAEQRSFYAPMLVEIPPQQADSQARSLEWERSIELRTVASSPYHRNNSSREDAQQTRDARLASCDAG